MIAAVNGTGIEVAGGLALHYRVASFIDDSTASRDSILEAIAEQLSAQTSGDIHSCSTNRPRTAASYSDSSILGV